MTTQLNQNFEAAKRHAAFLAAKAVMDHAALVDIMGQVNGSSIITIDTLTTTDLTGGKKNPFYGRVQKAGFGHNVMVFQNKRSNGYENMVNRRLLAEKKDPQEFVVGPRSWGTRLPECPFVTHNGQLYLEVIFLTPGIVQYFVDGEPWLRSLMDIEGLVLNKEEGVQGGLRDKVIIRTYNCNNIFGVRVNGVEHVLRK